MIGRRSKEFAGTRFLKRGANDEVCGAAMPALCVEMGREGGMRGGALNAVT